MRSHAQKFCPKYDIVANCHGRSVSHHRPNQEAGTEEALPALLTTSSTQRQTGQLLLSQQQKAVHVIETLKECVYCQAQALHTNENCSASCVNISLEKQNGPCGQLTQCDFNIVCEFLHQAGKLDWSLKEP